MNILEDMEVFGDIATQLNNLDIFGQMTVLCMLIDTVAGRQGMKGSEMIQEIMPILQSVNDEYGVMR